LQWVRCARNQCGNKLACAPFFSRRSFYVALAVGTVLNLINQGDALLGSVSINWLKLVLTYCVPYAVCTYGAVSHQLRTPDVPTDNRV
jgi:hypothetical protein